MRRLGLAWKVVQPTADMQRRRQVARGVAVSGEGGFVYGLKAGVKGAAVVALGAVAALFVAPLAAPPLATVALSNKAGQCELRRRRRP